MKKTDCMNSDGSSNYYKTLESYGLKDYLKNRFGHIKSSKKYSLEDVKEDFNYAVKNVRDNLSKTVSSKNLSKTAGIASAIVEGIATVPTLARANSLQYSVVEVGGKLWDIINQRELNWFEGKVLYPLSNINVGPVPLSTILWGAGMVVTGLVAGGITHYLTKKGSDGKNDEK